MKHDRERHKPKFFFGKILTCLVLTVTFVLLLGSSAYSQTVTLKFIETTDVHGAIYPYDFIKDREAAGSLAQVMTYVRQERSQGGQHVVLLDAGDNLQGQPVVYYYNFEKPEVTHLFARVMNYMGYDAAAVGNHDIEAGHAVYDKFRRELQFPWLAANALMTPASETIVPTDLGETYFEPYMILDRQGVRVAILGMVTPGIPNWLPPAIWEGMTFEDMVECARKWAPVIQQKESPDLLVGLFHSGVDYTYGGSHAGTPKNENASKLVAQQVPGFDLIFVGHDHQGWNLTVTNPDSVMVHVLGGSAHARDVAVATVDLTYDSTLHKWQRAIRTELVDMSDFEPDSAFMVQFAPEFEEVQEYVSRPIGTFTQTISAREAVFGDAAFADLIHHIQLELTGADLSFTAPLALDATIEAGTVTVRDMFNLYKYENLLYTMALTGREIEGFLEYSYARWFNHMQGPDDHLLRLKREDENQLARSRNGRAMLQTPAFNFDSAAGIDYTVDVSRPAGDRVEITRLANGEPFDLDRKYRVAVNSYRGNGGGGHLTDGAGIARDSLQARILSSTEKDLRYYIMKWIEKHETVTPELEENWRVVPTDWWRRANARDFELLFGE